MRGKLCTKIAINCKIADLTMTPHQSKDARAKRQRANKPASDCNAEEVAVALEALTFCGGASIDILLLSFTHTPARVCVARTCMYVNFWHLYFYFCCHSHFPCTNQGCESFLSHFSTSNVVLPKVAHSPFSQQNETKRKAARLQAP